MTKLPVAGALALGLCFSSACAQTDSEVALDTEESRILYTLGAVIGGNVSQFSLTESELEIVIAGLEDAVAGRDPRVDVDVYGAQLQSLADERAAASAAGEAAAAEAFLAEMRQEPGAEVTSSGLIYIPMTEGTGPMPSATDTVNVHYHGTLRDGTVFDSSVERGEPISFPLNRVIPCWTEGVQKIAVGGKAVLVCPAEIAYGDRGSPPVIPGGAALKFEVELFAIE